MSIYIPPTTTKELDASASPPEKHTSPEANVSAGDGSNARSWWRWAGIATLSLLLMTFGAIAWKYGVFNVSRPMSDQAFSERVRTISNAAELRATVARKLDLDRAYLKEAEDRGEEQMALTFGMSIARSIEDYRNAGSNWASALVDIYIDYQAHPELTRERFKSFEAGLTPTQNSTREALESSMRLLSSVPAAQEPSRYFSQELIAEPKS